MSSRRSMASKRVLGRFPSFMALSLIAACVIAAAPSMSLAASNQPDIQTLDIDETALDEDFTAFCGFEVEAHQVGTLRILTYPGGEVEFRQNITTTYTAVDTGESVTLSTHLQIEEIESETTTDAGTRIVTTVGTFRGLNYRIMQPGGAFISAGNGATTIRVFYDEDGFPFATEINDSSTPKLQHVTAIICSALTPVPFGSSAIAGTVTDSATGEPLRAVCVVSFTPDGTFENVEGTDASGSYVIPLLASGPHKVLFTACQDGLHADEWYDGRPSLEQASIVTITGHRAVKGIDASLQPQGIRGVVTDETTGAPLASICVLLYDDPNGSAQFVGVGQDDGTYATGVPYEGDFFLRFVDCSGTDTYISEWYDDSVVADGADAIHLTTGSLLTIDASLAVGASS